MVLTENWRSPSLPFSWLKPKHAAEAGAIGGRSRSKAKRAAVRSNGRLGGRPRKPEVKPPLLSAMEQAATAPRRIDPSAGRPPLDALRCKYVRVVFGSRPRSEREEEHWQAIHEDVPCPPRVLRRKVFYRRLSGFTELLGEAVLTSAVPTIAAIENLLDVDESRVGARKSTRERERLRIVRAVYWEIFYAVEGKTINPPRARARRVPLPNTPAWHRYVLEHGLPDEE